MAYWEHAVAVLLYTVMLIEVALIARRKRGTGWWLISGACLLALMREAMVFRAMLRDSHLALESAISAVPLAVSGLAVVGYWMIYRNRNGEPHHGCGKEGK